MPASPDPSNWSRDADGNFIDWTKPPYKVGGLINFVLPGENVSDQSVQSAIAKRTVEYTMICRKQMNQARKARQAANPFA